LFLAAGSTGMKLTEDPWTFNIQIKLPEDARQTIETKPVEIPKQ